MSRLYFIGAEDVRKPDSVRVHRSLLRDSPSCSVLVFAWNAPPSEKSNLWIDIYWRFFLDGGAADVQFADFDSPTRQISEQFSVSDLLYCPGGDARILGAHIRIKKPASAIKAFEGLVAGNSAGAMVMSRRAIFLRGQDGEPQISAGEGLALADINVSVYCGAADRLVAGTSPDDDLAALSEKMDTEIHAIPESSAVLIEGSAVSYCGDVFVFRDGRRLRIDTT